MTVFKKIVMYSTLIIVALTASYMAYVYYVPYSTGTRTGELIKVSNKGYFVKTWEGEISQGISGAQIFQFSVLDSDKEVIDSLQNLQGSFVKVTYVERLRTFFWWGDTRYFIVKAEKENSPYFSN
jgi:hypothetical protein